MQEDSGTLAEKCPKSSKGKPCPHMCHKEVEYYQRRNKMKIKKIPKFNFDMKAGTYCIDKGRLIMGLPCGHTFIPQGKWTEEDREDENKITLTPSIFCSPQIPCWHGFLTKGMFIKA